MNVEELLKEGPSLTLDPFEAEVQKEAAAQSISLETPTAPSPTLTFGTEEKVEEKPQQSYLDYLEDMKYLTEDEIKQVDAFAEQISIKDSNSVLQYGASTQKKMADFSEGTLEKVRTRDLGEIGDLLGKVVVELKDFDQEEEKGVMGFFKRKANKAQEIRAKYSKAEDNIEQISKMLEGHQITLLKDSAMLDQLYELNKVYFKELTMYIVAGKKKLAKVMEEDIPKARALAESTGRPEDAQEVTDLEAMCNRFEKKIHDLEVTRMVSLQMAPQIRMVQSSDVTMSEKIQSTLTNTIPLWKSQMIIALGVEHSQKAAQAQKQVSDLTNELLKKNAEKLQMATVETAKESERAIVDLETLVHTNETLIQTIDEVMRIQADGHKKRMEAEVKMTELEEELKKKLLTARQ